MAVRTYGDKIVGMAIKRTYDDSCAAAHALDLVGERWTLLGVRELLLGPKRFTDLRAGLPHVSPNVLSQRLRELESAGVVRRRKLPPPAASRIYELTEWGEGLEPVVISLGRWGTRSPWRPRDAGLSTDSLILSFPHDVRRARRRGVRGKLRAQARGGPLPRGGGRGGASRSSAGARTALMRSSRPTRPRWPR